MARKHHADSAWGRVMDQIRAEMERRQLHPSRTVLSYAQLMQEARSAWLRGPDKSQADAYFLPRLGPLPLVGKSNRIDHLADGSALVIDHKTKARSAPPSVSSSRCKTPSVRFMPRC